jgi:hypothetical protein
MDGPARQLAGATRGDTEEIFDAVLIGAKKSIEHRGHEHRPSFVRLHRAFEAKRVRLVHRRAQRVAVSCRIAELLRQLDQRRVLAEITPAVLNRLTQDLLKGEVLEDRHDVRKGFVESEHITIGRLEEIFLQPVGDGMGDFVRDDVVRQTREDRLRWKIGAGILAIGWKVSEQDGEAARIIKGIGAVKSMRKQFQRLAASEVEAAAESHIEILQDFHRHRVHHLLMKARIGFGGI